LIGILLNMRSFDMKRWFGAAAVLAILGLVSPATITPAAAAAPRAGATTADVSKTADLSARRRHYRHYSYRPYYQPYYYARPTYYRPYPYASPVPFFLGFGFGPWGW
jgi:hypothetical protein